jgi:hypothetical protein
MFFLKRFRWRQSTTTSTVTNSNSNVLRRRQILPTLILRVRCPKKYEDLFIDQGLKRLDTSCQSCKQQTNQPISIQKHAFNDQMIVLESRRVTNRFREGLSKSILRRRCVDMIGFYQRIS